MLNRIRSDWLKFKFFLSPVAGLGSVKVNFLIFLYSHSSINFLMSISRRKVQVQQKNKILIRCGR